MFAMMHLPSEPDTVTLQGFRQSPYQSDKLKPFSSSELVILG
jgi:hypothetical protein